MSKKGAATRVCPLCAETIKADATRCRACGSTLLATDLAFPSGAATPAKGAAAADGAWPAPAADDVGMAGPAAAAAGLLAFAAGAWLLEGATLAVVVIAAAGATFVALRRPPDAAS